ncbi:MAG: phosphatidylglycerophosphatase A [Succinivibrio sp.]|nr:phosphatidylglycerophosphatase A [Succinivibrio sp.]
MDKHDRTPLKRLSLADPLQLLAVGFGSGLLPKMPGTYGSLAALPLCAALLYLPLYVTLPFIALFLVLGFIAADRAEKALGMHDNSAIVVDEFAGMFISCLLYPPQWWWCLPAFVLFRIFDILKPFPIGFIDRRLGGGLGVMADDVVAGIYAMIAGRLFVYLVSGV